jgi:mono/diheme cytochrome c family protein
MRVFLRPFALISMTAAVALALAACTQQPPVPAAAPAPDPAEAGKAQIERGHMLVIGGGCHDCHTPKKIGPAGPEANMDLMLSGHPESDVITAPYKQEPGAKWTVHVNDHLTAWSGAWGVSFAANLTPDENTGIGIWTEDMFVRALKTGKHMGTSRQILPPMPWNWYGQLNEDELKAIFAYLKSIKPIQNRVPVPLGPDGKPIEQG